MKLKKFFLFLLIFVSGLMLVGCQGEPGIKGEKGDTGDNGATGAQGEKGEQGEPGKDGKPGQDGQKGDKGDKGEPGVDGTNGQELEFRINADGVLQQRYVGEDDTKWKPVLDLAVIAKWKAKYTFELDVDGGKYEAADQQVKWEEQAYLTKIELPKNVTKDGYTFKGWTDGEKLYTDTYTIEKSGKLTASYVPDPKIGEWPYAENTAYRLTLTHTNDKVENKVLYFTGKMAGWYFGTSTMAVKGVEVFCEKVEGGYKLYFMAGEVKNYIGIAINGYHINAVFGADVNSVFQWETNLKTMVTKIGEAYYFLGTKASDTFTTIGGCKDFTPGSQCVVTLTTPEIVPEPEITTNTLTSATLNLTNSYNAATATVIGIEYSFVNVGDYGSGIQMKKNAGTLKNNTAYATAIKDIVVRFNTTKLANDLADCLTFELLDDKGTVVETVKLSYTAGTAEATVTFTKEAKFFQVKNSCGKALYLNEFLVENK